MKPDVRAALDRLTAPAPHLRWRVAAAGDPLGEDELACTALAADPDVLATAVAASAGGRGSDDPQVLASLWWQAYAYRVAGTALACWLVSGVAPDARAEATAVGIARSRPSSVVYLVSDLSSAPEGGPPGTRGDDSRSGALEAMASGPRTSLPREPASGSHRLGDDGGGAVELDVFVGRLFAGHLDRVATSLRARHSLGRGLVWGNVAAACASAGGAVRLAAGPAWRDRLDAFLAAAPHGLAGFGAWTDPAGVDPRPDPTIADDPPYRRTTCCLWWKTSVAAGALCADCSLTRSPNETAPA